MSSFVKNITDFLSAESTLAKFTFVILLIITFITLLRLGSLFLGWLLGPDPTPHLIDGMIKSSDSKRIHVNPNINGSKPILKSDNQEGGIEFTWSTWIFVEGNVIDATSDKHIFHKGYKKADTSTILLGDAPASTQICPGLYIRKKNEDYKYTNDNKSSTLTLILVMTTYITTTTEDSSSGGNAYHETIKINDIPSNKWVNVIIRQMGNITDVYINGTIKERLKLKGIPLQNDGDVFIGNNDDNSTGSGNNFGLISNVWYWNYALGTTAIENIASSGPNTAMINESLLAKPYYLAFNWFLRDKR